MVEVDSNETRLSQNFYYTVHCQVLLEKISQYPIEAI